MTQCNKRRVLVLLVILVCSTLLAPQALASPEHAGWTIDIAKELLAEGWEHVPGETAAPVVGYAIHFVELERDVAKRMGFGFNLDTGEEGAGLWGIKQTDFGLEILLDTQFYFAPTLHTELGQAKESTSYDSWLITTSGRPIHVDISKAKIPAPAADHKEERLEIAILPKAVDGETGQIESEISLFYESLSGSMAQLQTTAWVGATSDRPIAVVAREVSVGRKTEYQYFAMYVAGTMIPDDLIPKDAAFIPMGTILGMQEVMEDAPERRLADFGLGAIYSSGSWGVAADGSLPIGQQLRVYGELQSLPEFVYVIGVEGGLNTEFYLVAEMGDVSGDGFALRLGIRDELKLGDNFAVSATLLPIQVTLAGPEAKFAFNWRLKAEYLHEDYGFWYQAHNDLGQVRHNLGASVFRSKPVEARLSWSWDQEHGGMITAGIRLKF
ncbi:MAG TPA: hypothetical protein VJZ70_07260 [Limnochordia bacterium]|nr:hypothetical protein [Limnochordia bacterium]